jgi:hypothetical protein
MNYFLKIISLPFTQNFLPNNKFLPPFAQIFLGANQSLLTFTQSFLGDNQFLPAFAQTEHNIVIISPRNLLSNHFEVPAAASI